MNAPRLARPEHTGANRCWPCTVANLVLLAAGCLAVAAVSRPASAALAVVGAGAVWLRGYLVPYTPRVAPRLAARLPGDPFHAGKPSAAGNPAAGSNAAATDGGRSAADDRDAPRGGSLEDRAAEDDSEAVLEALLEAGVLRPEGEDVGLDDAFAERWRGERRELAEKSPDDLAAAVGEVARAADAKAVTENGRTYVVLSDGSGKPAGETWLRRPVAVAEAGAARALADAGVDADRLPAAAHGLSVFLDECPTCESSLTERPAGGCCGPPRTDAEGNPLQALVCTACRAQFAVFD